MLIDLLWCVLGIGTLVAGAEGLVRGGSRLAARLGVRPIVIGLTVVAIGTSMPELAIGIEAALHGSGSLAVGNIVGTNILNLLFILGLSALMKPLSMQMQILRFDLPVMTAAAGLLLVLALDGNLSRTDGVVMLITGIVYLISVVQQSRSESRKIKADFAEEYAIPPQGAIGSIWRDLAWLFGGMVVILVGADWLVDGAVSLARTLGVSDSLIGLTIVAVGTSAPELVTTVVSTLKQERDIAVGNLLGSSIYNILLILGVTCVVPGGGLQLDMQLVHVDLPIMVIVTLACVPVFISGREVSRVEGGLFVATYTAYFGYLVGSA